MEKMKFETPDMAQMNVEKIAALFPNCVTESKAADGKLKKAVNFDALKQMLGESVAEGDESYEFTWVGKHDAIVEAAKPIRKTLRPCVEESKNFDTTENLYIEGDNLEALKLLQEGYLGKVKMIYIDPPYNTGNDFIYKDDFRMDSAKYAEESGAVDDEGNRMVQNSDSNGRFHSDWCSMIYSRLLLARNLLTDDGVIFISIDDNEQANLHEICDEIFGNANFEGHIHWRRRHNQPNDKTKMIGLVAEHILVYAKSSPTLKMSGVGKLDLTASFSNPDNDPRGPWASKPWKTGSDQSGSRYTIVTPNGTVLDGEWMGEESTYKKYLEEGRIYFPKNGDGMPRKKYYQFEREEEGQCATNWWSHEQFGHNQGANDEMTEMFGVKNIFSNPKPVSLIRSLIKISNAKKNDIILDFFSGSATTAHAVMRLNLEDGGHRRFILVQVPELTYTGKQETYTDETGKQKKRFVYSKNGFPEIEKDSDTRKAGFYTLCQVGKKRIELAAKKILEESLSKQNNDSDKPAAAKPLDIGFRVLKIDDSNMKDVYYSAGEISQQDLVEQISNIKDGRTDLDLLFGCLVDWGVLLSLPIKTETIENLQVYNVNDGDLVACFANDIPEAAIRQIAAAKPLRAVFRDSSFKSDSAKINVTEIFKTISPNTTVKVV